MTMTRLLTASAALALLAGPVAAQTMNQTGQPQTATQAPATAETTTQPAPATPPVAEEEETTTDAPAAQTTMTTTTTTTAGGTMGSTASGNPMAGGAMGVTASGQMSTGGATGALMSTMNGNVRVISNAPIPDTVENRARYGQPESNAGRRRIGEGPVGQTRTR